ncbi:MAG: ATP-binding cassette domain-containing protein [Hamadaea sp.]|uniref:ATP-binding cassette domain-containing protein n=1 Tax=Hamadaea sp. TaxID=2024425 RepID=UPI0017F98C72|nr:ATP-binding cassette domain-containing protein [Hamadaea sp.]NUR70870.1 ATP-binding cassette domain-containing protein [Hamadaea sp.]NUT20875.1 ATP-binding cassette domain-containing protein [Hamadaea sp.]
MASASIQVSDLVKTYPRDVRALDGLSFSVREGTVFGLLGPNGAGKSTAVRILSTLSRQDSGTAVVAGFDVTRQPDAVRREIGLVGQKLSAVPTATVRENVLLQGRMYGLKGRELAARTDEAIARIGLSEAAGKPIGFCSGGMKRRVDIAMGIVHRPKVLFLDEPTTGLDPDIRLQLWEDLAKLVRADGLTILLTTHYLEEADMLADEVAIMDAGRVVTSGSPATLKQELRGDTLVVELDTDSAAGQAATALADLGQLSDLTVAGRTLHARAEVGGAAVPVVLDRLSRAGLQVTSVTVAQPTLDDVYLQHTGHRLVAQRREELELEGSQS